MSDSEYEEEEFLVFADFKNQIFPEQLSDENSAIKIIGVESKNPVAEINGNIFKGTYDYAMGTDVFFEKDADAPLPDPLYEQSCRQKFKVIGKTNKVINFQRIYVENISEKKESVEDPEGETSMDTPTEDNLRLNVTYEEAIKQFPNVNDPQWKEKDLF
ncbi:uncharacterized protein LOC135962381 [Calliphora vicina]|uniref:uncharacterized protein LOC135962381 n=1 Tax=Calliphora vicina TaxID=7373 RepID=UPI00325C297F